MAIYAPGQLGRLVPRQGLISSEIEAPRELGARTVRRVELGPCPLERGLGVRTGPGIVGHRELRTSPAVARSAPLRRQPRAAPVPGELREHGADAVKFDWERPPTVVSNFARTATITVQSTIRSYLEAHGLPHLRVRKYGQMVFIESSPETDPIAHARLRRDTVHLWTLEIATKRTSLDA